MRHGLKVMKQFMVRHAHRERIGDELHRIYALLGSGFQQFVHVVTRAHGHDGEPSLGVVHVVSKPILWRRDFYFVAVGRAV